jgi:hypothetical protein
MAQVRPKQNRKKKEENKEFPRRILGVGNAKPTDDNENNPFVTFVRFSGSSKVESKVLSSYLVQPVPPVDNL